MGMEDDFLQNDVDDEKTILQGPHQGAQKSITTGFPSAKIS